MVLRKIFGPKRGEVTGTRGNCKIRIFTICNSRIIIPVTKSRRMRWAGHIASLGIGTGLYRILAENPEGKKSLVMLRRRHEDNIKTYLQNKFKPRAWIGLVWLRIGIRSGIV
jgi:hypothetical protein